MKVYGGICRYMVVYVSMRGAGALAAAELMPSELYHQGGMRIKLCYVLTLVSTM